jgi:hypothetical protein
MKKLLIVIAALALGMAATQMVSCGSGNYRKAAAKTVQKFFDAFYCGDVKKALPMIAPDKRPTLDAATVAEMNEYYKGREYIGIVQIGDPESYINETEAHIAVSAMAPGEFLGDINDGTKIYIDLERIDGRWYVTGYDTDNL